ncbi:hypothetical protein RXV88_11430 [Aestuariicoccus sp. MJ-SS9]|nr:hypothetical protein [Aestuariicoccus sp. MJ-SS9]
MGETHFEIPSLDDTSQKHRRGATLAHRKPQRVHNQINGVEATGFGPHLFRLFSFCIFDSSLISSEWLSRRGTGGAPPKKIIAKQQGASNVGFVRDPVIPRLISDAR